MYLEMKMPELAEYRRVVELIRWALEQQGLNPNTWAEAQNDRIISAQGLYDILNYKSVARYPTLYEIATRLGIEISVSLPTPKVEKK